jgi:transposase
MRQRRAGPGEKWQPEIEGLLHFGNENARTEGNDRITKAIKRVACGFRNEENYEWLIILHSPAHRAACTTSSRGQPRVNTKT